MASISRSRRTLEPQSGGKIVRPRRAAAARTTPYDRPTPRFANPPAENPNWLSKLILSPTRAVVSGAGKLISTVFGPDESSSSSSSSSEGTDDDDDDDISIQEDEGLRTKNGVSEKINFFRKEPPTTIVENDNKHVIEQMLMQETFSREECARLIKIIKSRVVGFTTSEDAENTRPNIDTPYLCGTAVTEAKKWLKEKRLGSTSKLYGDIGTGNLSSLMSPQGAEDEGGSPVDVAKSYMRARPPWASPSIIHEELRSPSIETKLFNEGTPYSIGGTSVSTSKLKRDTPATGSWNIQEELRRVRSKASEELLRSLPSTRIDWSGSALGKKSTLGSLPDGNREDEMGDKYTNTENAVGANVNLSSGIMMPSGSEVLEKTQYGLQKEALPIPAIISSEQNQDANVASIDGNGGASGSHTALEEMLSSGQLHEAIEDMKTAAPSDAGPSDFDGCKDSNGSEKKNPLVEETIEVADFELHDITFLTAEEVTGSRNAYTTNGFPSSVPSMSAELGREENARLSGEINLVSSSHENVAMDLTADETHDFVSEFMNEEATIDIEVSNKNENDVGDTKDNDFVTSGSQNSSSMPEEPSHELTQPKSRRTKTSTVVEKPKGTRLTKYNRRGRPRGK